MKLFCRLIIFVLLISPVFAGTTFDPLSLSVGVRALGMGNAYVAVADKGDTIFTNPAGLGEVDSFHFTSMAGRVLEDVNYTVLGVNYPMGGKSAIGIGFASATITDIVRRNLAGEYQNKAQFNNSVFLVSMGRKFSDQFSLGMNIKYFAQDGTEDDRGDGTGANIDIGVLQKGTHWLSFGLVGQNIASSSKFSTGSIKDDLPMSLKIGGKAHLLGQEFEAARLSPYRVIVAADANISLQSTDITTAHTGIELGFPHYLTVRLGVDQDQRKRYLTSGISLKIAGVGFHYAYHPYGETGISATHFFSLSFDERGFDPEEEPETFLGSL
ncbi:MAG: PorV/PorQ family protein [bacterium]